MMRQIVNLVFTIILPNITNNAFQLIMEVSVNNIVGLQRRSAYCGSAAKTSGMFISKNKSFG